MSTAAPTIRERTCAECGRIYWIEWRRGLRVILCWHCTTAENEPDPEPLATGAGRDAPQEAA